MKRSTEYTLFDRDKKKVGVYDDLFQIASVIEQGDSVTCTGYLLDGGVDYVDELTYEAFWESHFRHELFMEGIELKYFIPKTISDFYKGWRKETDWHIFQAENNIMTLNRDIRVFLSEKERATPPNK